MHILIFSPKITPRIRYIAEYIFHDYLQVDYGLTDSVKQFSATKTLKLVYADEPIDGALFVWQHPLLLQETIEKQAISLLTYNDLPAFFGTDHPQALFPFDLFAASFYLMSRYEEYLPHTPDRFGRFSPKNAIAASAGFLHKPIVNIWAKWLAGKLQEAFPEFVFPKRQFQYLPTYDIDQPYAYQHRGIIINGAGLTKSIVKRHFNEAKTRLLTLIRQKRDAYDTYGFQFKMQEKFGFRPYYFILCAQERGEHDVVLDTNNKHIVNLLHRIKRHGFIGIHPSFASASDSEKIRMELKRLSTVLDSPIVHSRQHYLLLKIPQTYHALLSNGIMFDFSMGYASRPGFRASVCTPFHFFDLTTNQTASLTIYPLTYMDGTLNDYMGLSRLDAQLLVKKLIDEVKAVDGLFISLWHNSSLSDSGHWRGWRAVYNYTLEYADSLSKKSD